MQSECGVHVHPLIDANAEMPGGDIPLTAEALMGNVCTNDDEQTIANLKFASERTVFQAADRYGSHRREVGGERTRGAALAGKLCASYLHRLVCFLVVAPVGSQDSAVSMNLARHPLDQRSLYWNVFLITA